MHGQNRKCPNNQRNHQRQDQDIGGIAPHRFLQFCLVHADFDRVAAHRCSADDVEDASRGRQQRPACGGNGLKRRGSARVIGFVDGRRHVGYSQQAALAVDFDDNGFGTDRVEQLLRQAIGHHVGGRGFQHHCGNIGRTEPIAEPVVAEIGDGGNIDCDFRQHDKSDDQQQHAAGKAKASALWGNGRHCHLVSISPGTASTAISVRATGCAGFLQSW